MKNLKTLLCLVLCIIMCATFGGTAVAYTPPRMTSVSSNETCLTTSMAQYNNTVSVGMQDPLISFSNYGTMYYTSSHFVLGADDTITISNTGLDCNELATVIGLLKKASGSHYKWTADDAYEVKNPTTGRIYLKKGESATIQVREILEYFTLDSQQMEEYLLCIIMTGFNEGEDYAHLARFALFEINNVAVEAIKTYPFDDVRYGSYYWDSVKWAYENGITTGTSETTFGPMETCTRGQVVTFLWRAKGCPEPTSTVNPFTDVKETDYFYKAVLWAVENGITNGMTETTFGPKETCTSGHVVTFLWRANGQPAAVGESTLVESGEWYSDAVAWADSVGLLSGTDVAFGVKNNAPRADIVTYLYRDIAE